MLPVEVIHVFTLKALSLMYKVAGPKHWPLQRLPTWLNLKIVVFQCRDQLRCLVIFLQSHGKAERARLRHAYAWTKDKSPSCNLTKLSSMLYPENHDKVSEMYYSWFLPYTQECCISGIFHFWGKFDVCFVCLFNTSLSHVQNSYWKSLTDVSSCLRLCDRVPELNYWGSSSGGWKRS